MALSAQRPHCKLLREERFDEFNRIAKTEDPDLTDANLRSTDLRKANLRKADLRGAYLRSADLRGVDLSKARMAGASLNQARVAGALFPSNLRAEEILLSIKHGIRMRVSES